MSDEELNTELFNKMFAEQETYRGWLFEQTPEDILRHTYEYTVREDILMALENNNISDTQASALMKSKTPLADVFLEFENMETVYMDTLLNCITDSADAMIKSETDQRKALLSTPVYKYPLTYAREHGELEQHRASHKANIECKEATETAIYDNYCDNCLGYNTAKQVISDYGFERTL